MVPSREILGELRRRVQSLPPADSAHDFAHIERVIRLTKQIYLLERAGETVTSYELEACECAALLHDCVPVAKNSPLRKESSRLAAEKAREWLQELSWDPMQIEEITMAILDHSYSAFLITGTAPRSFLGKCLQDADRLEALGAIGLYRVIATGVSMGASLFHPTDPWAESRELDDRRYSVDHFYKKLLKLPETFQTKAAKEEAKKRADFLKLYLAQLKNEI